MKPNRDKHILVQYFIRYFGVLKVARFIL